MTKVIRDKVEALQLVPGCTLLDNTGTLFHVPSRESLVQMGYMFANVVEDYSCMLPLNGEYNRFPLVVIWEPDWEVTFYDYAAMKINPNDGYPIGWHAREQGKADGLPLSLLDGAL